MKRKKNRPVQIGIRFVTKSQQRKIINNSAKLIKVYKDKIAELKSRIRLAKMGIKNPWRKW